MPCVAGRTARMPDTQLPAHLITSGNQHSIALAKGQVNKQVGVQALCVSCAVQGILRSACSPSDVVLSLVQLPVVVLGGGGVSPDAPLHGEVAMQAAPVPGQGLHFFVMGHPCCCPSGPLACAQHPCQAQHLNNDYDNENDNDNKMIMIMTEQGKTMPLGMVQGNRMTTYELPF